MKNLTRATIAGAVLVNISVIVGAQSPLGQESRVGNADRGAKIAAWGTSKGVASCSSCHGYDGAGNGADLIPRLAGQSSAYLMQQLDMYASGQRQNVYMHNFAQRLSAQVRADVSAYYASLRSSFPPPENEFYPALLARGRHLANVGDDKLTVQSCNNCHGPQGAGEYPDIPALKGQYNNYIVYRLQQLAATHNDADLMFPVASALHPDDMKAVGAYFENLGQAPVSSEKLH